MSQMTIFTENRETTINKYRVWKLDAIAYYLKGISTDHRIINNLCLIKSMFDDRSLSEKEILQLAGLYLEEFEKCGCHITGGYTPRAVKERFASFCEDIKARIWGNYVTPREDLIAGTISYRWRRGKSVPDGVLKEYPHLDNYRPEQLADKEKARERWNRMAQICRYITALSVGYGNKTATTFSRKTWDQIDEVHQNVIQLDGGLGRVAEKKTN